MRRRSAGFTLLEVMIALAILSVGLVAISNLNGGAVAMHAYSRRATEATLLLRGKMLDVEDDLQKNGFSDFSDEKHGDFSAEGAGGYGWSAEILKPDVELDPAQLLTLLGGQGKGGQQSNLAGAAQTLAGSLMGAPGATQGMQGGGGAAMLAGPMGGMFMAEAKTFIETLKKSVREIPAHRQLAGRQGPARRLRLPDRRHPSRERGADARRAAAAGSGRGGNPGAAGEPDHAHRSGKRSAAMSRRGFTILEVMIAIAVLSMIGAITFKSFDGAYDLKKRVENAEDRDQAVRGALDRIGREVSMTFLSEHYDHKRFRERPPSSSSRTAAARRTSPSLPSPTSGCTWTRRSRTRRCSSTTSSRARTASRASTGGSSRRSTRNGSAAESRRRWRRT